ncbi:acyltransferase [Maribellus sp. CM-23]|uniref:acyltransferase n=1 Tax=Maribellus sp. CM-23 TaxID=2781026 RepID=UPI001F18FEB8|nr:acyltransferase [Maribellus sp. CM-23]MCE4566489.1 acyltransferase [Maribellus sp. CM-23]
MTDRTIYQRRIQDRSMIHFIAGLYPRFLKYLKFSVNRYIARLKGADIGSDVLIPFSLACKANPNLSIGNNVSIDTNKIDLRIPIQIGNNVIIGANVEIITCSHNIDSEEWEYKTYGLKIEDFAWLSTNALILPSCRKIGVGAVIGAGSVVVKNVEGKSVVAGNPAEHLKWRKNVHSKIIVESLLGGDLIKYIQVRLAKKN